MFKSPFKPIGHYVFDYKPRYYDERKERIAALESKYKKKEATEDVDYEISLSKNNLREAWSRSRSNASADRKSNIRLAIIITVLVGIVLYILK